MAKFRKKGGHKLKAISTASLPDIVFMLLFFFMSTTHMKETTYKVEIKLPHATQLTKLEKKSLVRYVYIGTPNKENRKFGTDSRIQLDDEIVANPDRVMTYIATQNAAMKEEEKGQMIVSIKADEHCQMGIVSDVKQALRKANALRVNYTAKKPAKD